LRYLGSDWFIGMTWVVVVGGMAYNIRRMLAHRTLAGRALGRRLAWRGELWFRHENLTPEGVRYRNRVVLFALLWIFCGLLWTLARFRDASA